ncbi:NlpC/P60 family protein [Catellatospora bangladeshensis]|uniref:Peptidase P60 n=1 Tax=Catellatospora bangladeshensis TaxID=310355 RepID=A0A8J3JMU0_9ACTN|nr:NlpC/P60 family protein [Catellatospora bangladeshensis]GIF81840.1 peptidase P60 [Catellatospora bangladeshensis]
MREQTQHLSVAVSVAGLWTSPEAVRPLDAPLLAAPSRLREWAAAQGPDERRQLWGRLETQLLLGEPVTVHETRDGWARVTAPWQPSRKDPRGYPGWVPLAQLAAPAPATADRVVVTEQVAELRDAPGGTVLADDVSFATVLPALGRRDGHVEVGLPGGGTGWLADKQVTAYATGGSLPTAEQLITAGRLFLGLMYLAGGSHGLTLDCSGLTHLIYRRFGHPLPRDADDQALVGEHVEVADLAPGDLPVFQNDATGDVYHVGICTGTPQQALHVSQPDWACLDGTLTETRQRHLVAGRRLRSL